MTMPVVAHQSDIRAPASAPKVLIRELRALWFQITGTLCNLACRHCFNASGPRDPGLGSLDSAVVRRYIADAEALGVKEFYFTGGEPFLHPEILPLLEAALAVAPTTVLTNGTLIDGPLADRLAGIAADSSYSLEVRISIDAADEQANDAIRGTGSFAKALRAIKALSTRKIYPIVTATEIGAPRATLYEQIRRLLLDIGVERPRIKILPVLPIGRCRGRETERYLTAEDLAGFDLARLQCTETRVVADGGIYACPILAGLPGARLGVDRLADPLRPTALYHRACYTCYETGIACKNF
jgi:MoaA/NifB/PqqE/SkfB family radical SAM enzyme